MVDDSPIDESEIVALVEALTFGLKRKPSVSEVKAAVDWATDVKVEYHILELIKRGEVGLHYDQRDNDWIYTSRE